jgi:hypothetical protein
VLTDSELQEIEDKYSDYVRKAASGYMFSSEACYAMKLSIDDIPKLLAEIKRLNAKTAQAIVNDIDYRIAEELNLYKVALKLAAVGMRVDMPAPEWEEAWLRVARKQLNAN